MLDITLDNVIEVLGNPTRISGHQYYFRCPVCSSSGCDTSGDNLLFNEKKGVLKCFACDNGAKEVLRMINSSKKREGYVKKEYKPIEKKEYIPWWKKNTENLLLYMCEAEQEMNEYVIDWLWREYGINEQTVKDCSIGFDKQPNMVKIGSSVVFPMFSLKYDGMLTGFELRQIGAGKVIKHTLDAPSSLCKVWGRNNSDYLIILEGFKDAYTFKQMTNRDFLICTPAHGCKDILRNMGDIDFRNFKKCYLLLDNDEAGDTTTTEILEKYPFFIDKRDYIKGYKDLNDYWKAIR